MKKMAKVLYLSCPLYPHCNFPILGALHFLLPTLDRLFLFSLPLRLTHGNVISQQQPAPSFKNANWIMSVSCSKTFNGSPNCPQCPTTSCFIQPRPLLSSLPSSSVLLQSFWPSFCFSNTSSSSLACRLCDFCIPTLSTPHMAGPFCLKRPQLKYPLLEETFPGDLI